MNKKKKRRTKLETSKKLLITDYLIALLLVLLSIIFANRVDLTTVLVSWIAQLGVSSGFYYWKAKSENRVKVPISVIESLPQEVQDKVDLTQIIISIVQSE